MNIHKYSFQFHKLFYNIVIDEYNTVIRGFFSYKPMGNIIIEKSVGNYVKVINLLNRYFKGEKVDFNKVKITYHYGTPFEKEVWNIIRGIPYGHVRTYKWVAEQIGLNRGYRAVGRAISRNPIAIIIPCHRVIKSNKEIGGFTSAGGIELKRKLLSLEKIKL